MHGPDGTDFKNKSVYKEVVKYEKLVYDHITGPKFQFTVTFQEKENKTLLTIQMLFETAEEKENVIKVFKADVGLKQNMYKLEGYLRRNLGEREMKLTRTVRAPRALVFRAWIDPEQLKKWWGPKGFTNPLCQVDTVPGGSLRIDMKAPDGIVYPMDGEFHEIVEPERIVFTTAALDKNGNRLFEVLNTVTFIEENGFTKLSLHATVSKIKNEGKHYIDGMDEGWSQSIDRLSALVSNENQSEQAPIVMERIFNAPVEKVWKALTDLEQIKQWYFDISAFRPEVGFEFQFFGEGSEGEKYLHRCKITEVIPFKKLQYSWRYEGYEGNSLLSWELFDENDKTRIKLTHQGVESFAANGSGFFKNNFMQGWTYFMDKALKEFLEKK
jgi:uncharacterized protein YndB with AHSA1/START domain